MWNQRLFHTTRGKVLLLLKRHGTGTVASLSQELQLTHNAIRQHLSALERDNLVAQHPQRIGRHKPTQVYSLTPAAESLFPKHYDTLLLRLIPELYAQQGDTGVSDLLCGLGRSAALPHRNRLTRLSLPERVREVGRILEEYGSITDVVETDDAILIRDHNCPYAVVVRSHPEACQVECGFLQQLLEPAVVAIGCDPQRARCEFRVTLPAD